MIFHWLIRSFAIALLMLYLSLWGYSYFYNVYVIYNPSSGKTYAVGIYMGGANVSFTNTLDLSPPWLFDRMRHRHYELPSIAKNSLYFYYEWNTYPGTNWIVSIPFWFPSLLAAALLWFVWRQTRPKTAGRGFPVEITQSNPSSTN